MQLELQAQWKATQSTISVNLHKCLLPRPEPTELGSGQFTDNFKVSPPPPDGTAKT